MKAKTMNKSKKLRIVIWCVENHKNQTYVASMRTNRLTASQIIRAIKENDEL